METRNPEDRVDSVGSQKAGNHLSESRHSPRFQYSRQRPKVKKTGELSCGQSAPE
jgi:hypothetical protein